MTAAQAAERTADFGITMVDAPDPTTIYNTVHYTITVTNHGPDTIPARDTLVDHWHVAGGEVEYANGPLGPCPREGPVRCELDEMSAGETATVTVGLRPRQWGDLKTYAHVSGSYFDPNPENNDATATTFVAGEPPPMPPPWLSPLELSQPTFVPTPSGGSISRARGTWVAYELSDPATVHFSVRRSLPGRRVRGRCVAPTRRTRKHRRCRRTTSMPGGFSHAGRKGENRFRFSGRLRNRALPAGTYRLVGLAIDARGERSSTRTAGFRIIR